MKKKSSTVFLINILLWALPTVAGVVLCLATLFGFLGRFSWFLDLFSHFRVQYLIGLAILGTLFLLARRRRTGIVFLVFACVNLLIVLPLYFDEWSKLPQDAPALRAMLINVNTHLGDPERVRQFILDANPDILVLEEINSRWVADMAWLKNSHPHSVTQPRGDNFGIGLYSKLPLTENKVAYIGSAEVPSILATINTGQTNLRVVATHPLPPGDRDYSRWRNEQLDRLPDYIRSSLPVLLLGDLNVTPWNYIFRRLLKRSGLKDSSQGFGVQPTWPNYNLLFRIPIDHCLHSPDIEILGRRIGADVSSDHYPLIVDFAIVAKPEGYASIR